MLLPRGGSSILVGVVYLDASGKRKWLLQRMPIEEVWGVGRRMKEHLALAGIKKPGISLRPMPGTAKAP